MMRHFYEGYSNELLSTDQSRLFIRIYDKTLGYIRLFTSALDTCRCLSGRVAKWYNFSRYGVQMSLAS